MGSTEGAGGVSFDRVAAERERLDAAALTIDQAWGKFIASRPELEAIGEEQAAADDQDPVRSLLAEARARLHRAQIEVVVAGFLNRGKSTLLNALLGVEVSSMRVTPETARPVYVRYGERRAWVAYPSADGPDEDLVDIDPTEASGYGGYRPEEANDGGRKPSRVIQQLPVDLLRSGVILKDTPGLDDANPALADELENLTLAELDRATATLFVLCCPPGLSGSEVRILQSLDARRVDKLFIVCNFWSDIWEDDDEREAVLDHVRRTVTAHTSATVHLISVNAKRGWNARKKGDAEAFERSGVKDLADRLERYLAGGVHQDVLLRSEAFLGAARDEVISRADERLALLRDVGALKARQAEKEAAVAAAHSRLEEIAGAAHADLEATSAAVASEIRAPFDQLGNALLAATTSADLQAASMRFDVQYEAALARATVLLRDRGQQVEQDAKRRLTSAFNPADSAQVALYSGTDHFEFVRVSASLQHRSGPDWNDVWLGAAGGALIGGALAGGAGIALLALGPVGWLAGAALGFVLGGTLFAGLSSSGGISSSERQRLHAVVEGQSQSAQAALAAQVRASSDQLVAELRSLLSAFAGEELAELAAVEAVANDPHRRAALEAAAEEVRTSVAGLRLG